MNVMMTLIEAILLLVGAASAEELDEHEEDRFLWLNAHPLNINSASRRALSESGLFTDFQVVALLDYISETGAVLSRSELALVDGFDSETAEALAFFVRFGEPDGQGRWRTDARLYSGALGKWSAGASGTGQGRVTEISGVYGADCRVACGERCEFGLAGAGTWNRQQGSGGKELLPAVNRLSALSVSSAVALPGNRLRLYAGDFNLRFGQGLSAWNTMSIDDPSSVSSLIRRPTGLKLSRSLTGNYAQTGLGAAFEAGPVTLSASLTAPGLKKVLLGQINSSRGKNDVASVQGLINCNWWHRRFSLGLTSVLTGTPALAPVSTVGSDAGSFGADSGSRRHTWGFKADFAVDFRGCFGGFDLASEFAGGVGMPFRAVVSATSPRLAEHFRVGASLRYSRDRHIAQLSSEFSSRRGHSASVSLRLRHRSAENRSVEALEEKRPRLPGTNDCRIDARYRFRWGENSSVAVRLRENLDLGKPKTGSVFNCRADVSVGYAEIWASGASASFSRSGKWGMVAFLEESCRASGVATAYLRAGLFSVDDWAGRIYVYEHDLPGRFNVPAFYGRGAWSSLLVSWKFCRAGKLSARLAYWTYPFMPPSTRKPDKAEGRLMLTLGF